MMVISLIRQVSGTRLVDRIAIPATTAAPSPNVNQCRLRTTGSSSWIVGTSRSFFVAAHDML